MRNSGNHAMKEETSRWREWLREHGARLLLFARQQSRRQEDAEDILQEALRKDVEADIAQCTHRKHVRALQQSAHVLLDSSFAERGAPAWF